jgi:DNA-binding CsgD family transcriptional regulator
VAKALRLQEQKDTEGKALINYFSKPCKPTKTNGGRTRNLPHHDPVKWAKFLAYCQQDVTVEREIAKRLERFPVPASEWTLWHLDQKINRYGIRIDADLVKQHERRAGAGTSELDALTPRQRQILQLVAEGQGTRQIAERLFVSIKTVETHRAQLMQRLGIFDVPGLVRFAIRNGLLPPEAS